MRVVSLFSGIGGFEAGFAKAGFKTILMCEADPAARAVLEKHFPTIELRKNVKNMRSLPTCDVLSAGWPCQDLSQAGRTAGASGERSSLIEEVFRLVQASVRKPEIILLENVAFALHLQKGKAIDYVTDQLTKLGYRWAYRILDSRHFGLPQRRRRLFIIGARSRNPSDILFDGFENTCDNWPDAKSMFGFYWTEGNTGLGWTPGAIPPLKGGSGLSIPSPPAIWEVQNRNFVVPGIRDAERMQGFHSSWTKTDDTSPLSERARWRLVGNAVSVPVVKWLAERIKSNDTINELKSIKSTKRPNAGTGGPNEASRSMLLPEGPPVNIHVSLENFELRSATPLSQRAALGFFQRLTKSSLRTNENFVSDLATYTR